MSEVADRSLTHADPTSWTNPEAFQVTQVKILSSNKSHASSNKCLTTSNKKLLELHWK